ncbi:DNA sulfur modification protein DndB [Vibrio cholerae]|uniref:DNA sulfur modification protein DndB n=1 Tax=Vibrio cholerae TaxID=666 RepID=UPI00226DD09E|nr:DNA sulfur modification protein DndB [Vibrio cholerae]MCX9509875.1 DNA sulfur modification protein DndB [Vibrio cholerae]
MSNNFCYEFPVVRGIQAGRVFYMATVPMRVVKNMFKLDTGDGSALSRSQREVNLARARKFAQYLQENKDSFVVPALTGFVDVEPGTNVEFKESNIANVGMLSVPMDAGLLFVDGQHRASGVAIAMEDSDTKIELGAQSAPVMLFESLTLEERQSMFSDINGNVAKPAQALSDTYNNRDELAVFAKELAVTIPQFIDLVDFERNVVSGKSTYLFSIKTIKEVSATVAGLKNKQSVTNEDKALITQFWQGWFERIGFEEKFARCECNAQQFKEKTIITTGVVMKAAALAVKEAGIDNIDFTPLSEIDWSRDSKTFHGRCVDAQLKTMKADSTATKLTAAKLLALMGVELPKSLAEIELKVFGQIESIKVKEEFNKPSETHHLAEQHEVQEPVSENLETECDDESIEKLEQEITQDDSTQSEDWRLYVNLSEADAILAIKNNCKRIDLSNEQLEEAGEKLATVSSEGLDHEHINFTIGIPLSEEQAKECYFKAIRDFILGLDKLPDQNEIHKSLLNIRSIRRSVRQQTTYLAKELISKTQAA